MSEENEGLVIDPVFVAATRPPMRWGVTYSALMANMVVTMEIFILVKNPLTLLLAIPVHGLCALLCARDPRFFDLALLWCQTKLPAFAGNFIYWRGSSYSPLVLDAPTIAGRRRAQPRVVVAHRALIDPRSSAPQPPSPTVEDAGAGVRK